MRHGVLFSVFALTSFSFGADSVPDLKPQMLVKKEMMLEDSFSKPLAADWKVAKGSWVVENGSITGKELAADMHGAVMRRDMVGDCYIIQAEVQLNGTKAISFSFNYAKGHLGRVRLTPKGVVLSKDDQDGKKGPDKAEVIGKLDFAFQQETWYTVMIEVHKKEMMVQLSDKVVYGSHEKLDQKTANFGLTVAGESAKYRNLKVWQAEIDPTWEKKRANFQK